MKNIILSLALVLPLVLSAQYSSDYLQRFTESGKTGWRFSTAVAANYGDIGSEAVDLSYSGNSSSTKGATGDYSIAMGEFTTASGDFSTAMGEFTTASGDFSTAMGEFTTASGTRSTAMGESTTASGPNSTAMGESTTASGDYSTAMGYFTRASDYASLTIGQHNSVNSTVTSGGNATSFDTDNAAFVIGNGTASNAVSDAFVVYFNGNATLSGDLTINSDERLKDNIQPLGSTLNKLHQIEGKTYSLKEG
jgi:autotransporter adhesin